MTIAIIAFIVLFALLLFRIPLAYAMALVGFVGYYFLLGGNYHAAIAMVSQRLIDTTTQYSFSVIPLFILMGNIANRAGLSDGIYRASNSFLGHYRGGQAMATIIACGGFAAISGSSLATAATMAKVAVPQMRQYGYHDSLASAVVAAGGTLGILIPPSVILIVYGVITEQNIGQLFAAGLIPGILGIIFYLAAVRFSTQGNKSLQLSQKAGNNQRLKDLYDALPTAILFIVVIGGIYAGFFTPTEAAAIGAFAAMLIGFARRTLSLAALKYVLLDSAKTSCVLFSIIVGALIFSNFINRAGLPQALLDLVGALALSPAMVIMLILIIYLILGCILDSMAMLLLTVPLFFPVVEGLGFNLVWFGILVVVVIEISLITPPIGMNIFILQKVLPDIKIQTIFKGLIPFLAVDILRLAVIALFPVITLWLPNVLAILH